jgi:hypothetical protein
MIIAQADDITLWERETEVFTSIPTAQKELVVLPSTSHMTLYSNLTALDLAARAAGSWFSTHLAELPTVASSVERYS